MECELSKLSIVLVLVAVILAGVNFLIAVIAIFYFAHHQRLFRKPTSTKSRTPSSKIEQHSLKNGKDEKQDDNSRETSVIDNHLKPDHVQNNEIYNNQEEQTPTQKHSINTIVEVSTKTSADGQSREIKQVEQQQPVIVKRYIQYYNSRTPYPPDIIRKEKYRRRYCMKFRKSF